MKYEHRVSVALKDGRPHVIIDRVEPNGRRHFCTHYALPDVTTEKEGLALMDRVAEWLGNSLLVDSQDFRKHIGLEGPEKPTGAAV